MPLTSDRLFLLQRGEAVICAVNSTSAQEHEEGSETLVLVNNSYQVTSGSHTAVSFRGAHTVTTGIHLLRAYDDEDDVAEDVSRTVRHRGFLDSPKSSHSASVRLALGVF